MMRFAHVNIVARDWRALQRFYCGVFDCTPIPPERDLSGAWIDRSTGMEKVRIQGVHLSLPGCEDGPTLEIFQYDRAVASDWTAPINRAGLAHLAFAVDDVESSLKEVLGSGGSRIGEIVTTEISGAGTITFVYARDPEGNIIELQRWH